VGICDAVILPGSKNVFHDYQVLSEGGMVAALLRYHAGGGRLAGICGGYQMLGMSIADPYGVEGAGGSMPALGLLPVASTMEKRKITSRAAYTVRLPGQPRTVKAAGYEIHMGRTVIAAPGSVVNLSPPDSPQGAFGVGSADGRVWGTYLHGLFDSDDLRDCFLGWAGGRGDTGGGRFCYHAFKEEQYNLLADIVEQAVDVPAALGDIAAGF
jgi:adenosylcobyric acid synthase